MKKFDVHYNITFPAYFYEVEANSKTEAEAIVKKWFEDPKFFTAMITERLKINDFETEITETIEI